MFYVAAVHGSELMDESGYDDLGLALMAFRVARTAHGPAVSVRLYLKEGERMDRASRARQRAIEKAKTDHVALALLASAAPATSRTERESERLEASRNAVRRDRERMPPVTAERIIDMMQRGDW